MGCDGRRACEGQQRQVAPAVRDPMIQQPVPRQEPVADLAAITAKSFGVVAQPGQARADAVLQRLRLDVR